MMVRLVTRDGGFVHETDIPPFNIYPDVIFWGTRTFRLNDAGRQEPTDRLDVAQYVEAFSYSLVPPKTLKKGKGK